MTRILLRSVFPLRGDFQLFLYKLQVRQLRELLKNCINYFERDERQMRINYEQRIEELSGELERRKTNGDVSGIAPKQAAMIQGIVKWV